MRLFPLLCFALAPLTCPAEDLRVLCWNVQRGANAFERGPEKALQVIRDSAANVVLMQESYDIDGDRPLLGPWLATQLGWNSYQGSSPHLCILTKFPILKTFTHTAWNGVGARIKTPDIECVVWSCWIDSESYLPDFWHAHPDSTAEELLACETTHSARFKQIQTILARLKKLKHLDDRVPLLVGGDWNCPSHLDYGPDTRKLHRGLTLRLPCSLAFEQAGLMDTFRAIYPSALKTPGETWSPLYRWEPKTRKPMPMDRIDRLYLRGPQLRPVSAIVYPKKLENPKLHPAKRQFPSDHSAVLTVLRPVPMK